MLLFLILWYKWMIPLRNKCCTRKMFQAPQWQIVYNNWKLFLVWVLNTGYFVIEHAVMLQSHLFLNHSLSLHAVVVRCCHCYCHCWWVTVVRWLHTKKDTIGWWLSGQVRSYVHVSDEIRCAYVAQQWCHMLPKWLKSVRLWAVAQFACCQARPRYSWQMKSKQIGTSQMPADLKRNKWGTKIWL